MVGLVSLGLASLVVYASLLTVVGGLHSAAPSRVEQLWPAARIPFDLLAASGLLGATAPAGGTADVATCQHAAAAGPYAVGVTLLFLLYVASVALVRDGATRSAVAIVFAFGVAFQLLALASPWMLSDDVYSYVFYGRIVAVYEASPYSSVPADYPADPFFEDVYWKSAPSFYGPLWTLLSAALAWVAGDRLGLAVSLFRGLTALAAILTGVLVWTILDRTDRRVAVQGTLLLIWNPLLVLESGLSGHNEAVMILFMTLAVGLVVWGRPALAPAALILAAFVKIVALAFAPLLGIYLLRRLPSWRVRLAFLSRSAAVAALASILIVLPVWAGPATFAFGTLGRGADRYVNSLAELALGELRVWFGESRRDTEVPLQFKGWWVATHAAAPLRSEAEDSAPLLREVSQWTELLVVGPERHGWLRVYDPTDQAVGFVRSEALGPATRPAALDDEPEVRAREQGPVGSPSLQRANGLIRAVGWTTFGIVLVVALVAGTRSLGGLAQGWLAVLVALLYVASTWFWPWYALWGLAAAPLAPRAALTRWLVYLTWGVLLLYATLGLGESRLWYVQTYRALPVFGLPLLLFAIDGGLRRVTARASAREPTLGPRGATPASASRA